ncbi:hypothetical protein EC912_108147 [Luteibacter rhizovicinus]|uniref:Lipoprotein n=1 Tax=Luteibacter rhizovicinus TaxID=242606 RepID=A0A4R3YMU2_9GAMM|nr:hypothetical protein [Luteibacter rhizovicinus]TCV92153.1 hypothetical protein EC912_108147 [Luteibacter rhizovicinus]
MKKISLIATTCLALAFAGAACAATNSQDGVSGGNGNGFSGGNGGNSNFSGSNNGFSGGNGNNGSGNSDGFSGGNAIRNAFTYQVMGLGKTESQAFLDMQKNLANECVAVDGAITNIGVGYFTDFSGNPTIHATGSVTCETPTVKVSPIGPVKP